MICYSCFFLICGILAHTGITKCYNWTNRHESEPLQWVSVALPWLCVVDSVFRPNNRWYCMLQVLMSWDWISGPDEDVSGAVKSNGVKEGLVSNGI